MNPVPHWGSYAGYFKDISKHIKEWGVVYGMLSFLGTLTSQEIIPLTTQQKGQQAYWLSRDQWRTIVLVCRSRKPSPMKSHINEQEKCTVLTRKKEKWKLNLGKTRYTWCSYAVENTWHYRCTHTSWMRKYPPYAKDARRKIRLCNTGSFDQCPGTLVAKQQIFGGEEGFHHHIWRGVQVVISSVQEDTPEGRPPIRNKNNNNKYSWMLIKILFYDEICCFACFYRPENIVFPWVLFLIAFVCCCCFFVSVMSQFFTRNI